VKHLAQCVSEMHVFLHLHKKGGISNASVLLQLVREQVRREELSTKRRKEAERHGSVFPTEARSLFSYSQIMQEAMQPDQRAV